MKKLLFLLAVVLCSTTACLSQSVPTGVPQTYGFNWVKFKGFVESGQAVLFNARDTNFIPIMPALVYRDADSSMYYYNKRKWNKFFKVGDAAGSEADPTVAAHIKAITVPQVSEWTIAYTKRVSSMNFDNADKILSIVLADGSQVNDTINFPITSLSSNATNTAITITPSGGGTSIALNGATGLVAGLLTAADKVKYDQKYDSVAIVTDSVLFKYRSGAVVDRDTIRLPSFMVADGSETKIVAGSNVSVSGTGTTASPYVISSTGGSGGGGYAFFQNVNVSDANYTITTDSVSIAITYTALTADRTVTLPAAANNVGRIIWIRHGGNGLYNIILSSPVRLSATVTSTTIGQDGEVMLMSDNTQWVVKSK